MNITYKNSELLVISEEEERVFDLGDNVNISMRTSNYSLHGFIDKLEEDKLILKDGTNTSYSIGYDYIKDII
ncbi:hypothetical protein ACSW9V_15440 (plasmid) [Clostridium perfringens]|nr:hypothetical protein [Clostridium perfringens]EGT0693486.1 hypothetical protein [Clostridium perfringens]EGT0697064.1 hypothetical protein [Clostridium perfringens]MDU3376280.1 hypothetical protein [Clostridium perfringens]MDU3534237.1 hypothetical protein [Clostridium perfringens]